MKKKMSRILGTIAAVAMVGFGFAGCENPGPIFHYGQLTVQNVPQEGRWGIRASVFGTDTMPTTQQEVDYMSMSPDLSRFYVFDGRASLERDFTYSGRRTVMISSMTQVGDNSVSLRRIAVVNFSNGVGTVDYNAMIDVNSLPE